MNTHDAAVLIGRFQPFHHGHAALLHNALAMAPRVVVVIGSAHQARTPKNPFTWSERAATIRSGLTPEERDRVSFVPVRDQFDDARWTAAVRRGVVDELAMPSPAIALVGHFKDATSDYLRGFPGWALAGVERTPALDATSLRDAYFSSASHDLEATLAALTDQAPASTLEFLRAWRALPFFGPLAAEWRWLRDEREAWSSAPYPPVFVTVDAVVRCAGHVLLIRRGRMPGRGLLALPGGFIDQRETLWQSALRELREETSFALLDDSLRRALKSVAVFDHPDRSLRGRTITHAHFFDLGTRELPELRAGDDAAEAQWFAIERLPLVEDGFHDDHFHILDHFLGITM